MYYDTTANEFKGYTTSSWDSLGGGASLWTQTGNDIYYNTGNIGIGTTEPSEKLTVVGGNIRVQGQEVLFEGFEGETFPPTNWTTGGNANWYRDTTTKYQGTASAASGTITDSQSTWLDLNYTFSEAAIVSFYWKVSSEECCDFLVFCLDNDACTIQEGYYTAIDGEVSWTTVSVYVSAGTHSFRWLYGTDGGYLSPNNKGWVDNVTFESPPGKLYVSGNLGIGTTNPSSPLDVAGTAQLRGASGGTGLYVNSSGNVGIGTTTPSQKLEVVGNIKISGTGNSIEVASGGIKLNTAIASRPDCSASTRGTIWVSPAGTTGGSDRIYACVSRSAGAYLWMPLLRSKCGESVTFTYKGSSVTYGTVENPITGECWMDRNLGASQVATAYNDSAAYGDLFQWGRLDDGHQTRTSATSTTLSITDNPGHNKFIIAPNTPYNWRSPQNDSLWQGDGGINDPCPPGWRVPTKDEWDNEMDTWSPEGRLGAFASPLKLPATGQRSGSTAALGWVGYNMNMWSSTLCYNYESITAMECWSDTDIGNCQSASDLSTGFGVRCIKN